MIVRRLIPVLLAACAAFGAAAQDLSLDDDEGAITLGEPVEKKRATAEELKEQSKELAKQERMKQAARVVARLKASAAAASNEHEREKIERKIHETLTGVEKVNYAIELRDAKASSEKLRVDMARWLAGEIRVEFGIWGTHWYRKYCENWPDAELERYEKEYFLSLDVLEKLAPKDSGSVHRHADALLYRYTRKGDRADAEKALGLFEREISLRKGAKDNTRDAYALAAAWWGRINCLFALKGTNETVAAIHAFKDLKLKVPCNRYDRGYVGMMDSALSYLEKEPYDLLRLPFHTASKAFPEPQQAEYTETFAAAPAVRIEAKGIARDDPRFRLLEVKYRRYGIAVKDDAPFVVSVEVDPATKIFDDLRDTNAFARVRAAKRYNPKRADGKEREDKSPDEFRDYMANEGYVLEVAEKGAKIAAKTRQGALWGIVSLIQMTDRDRKAVRIAKLRDWPDVEKRGYLGTWWAPTLEYTLFQKMNTVDHQRHPCFENRFEPLAWHIEAEMGRQFHDFGLELFYGMCWITHAPQIPMAYPRTLPYRVSVMKRYASAHIGVYYPLDDIRFPVEKPDLDKFGSAAAIDGKHQTAIYREVIKEYPDWRFVVCAPFYWGPDGRCHFYPEQRDPYLAQWRKDLDPRIETYWTGPRVKSYRYLPYHNAWALKAYGRRPYMFQNGMGWHNLLGYTIDEMDWPSMYCKGTLDKVLKAYHINAHTPTDCAKIATLGDALWNLGGYDPACAVRRGVAQLMGEKMFDLLYEGYGDLCYFDKYKYGAAGDEVLAEDLEDLERRVANIDRAWKKATAYAKEVGSQMYGHYGSGIGYAHKVLASRRAPRNFDEKYKGLLEETRGMAQNETHFDEKTRGDVYYAPTHLNGGVMVPMWKTLPDTPERAKDHPRLTVQLSGAGEERLRLKTISGSFTCESFPPQSDYLLCVCAVGTRQLRVKVNDTVVFEGKKTFGSFPKFKVVPFKIPAKVLKRSSTFAVENLSKDEFNVSYAVMLMTDRIRREEMSAEESIIDL